MTRLIALLMTGVTYVRPVRETQSRVISPDKEVDTQSHEPPSGAIKAWAP